MSFSRLSYGSRLQTIWAQPSPLRTVVSVFVPHLFFGFTRRLFTAGSYSPSWCGDGAHSSAFWPVIFSTPLVLCIRITSPRASRSRFPCSPPSSLSVCSLACYSRDPAICGSSRSFMASVTPTSSGALITAVKRPNRRYRSRKNYLWAPTARTPSMTDIPRFFTRNAH